MKFILLTNKYDKAVLINLRDIQLVEPDDESDLTSLTIRGYSNILVKEGVAEIISEISSLLEYSTL